jgi:uncharacterized protein (UPF0218 family)
VKAHRLPDRLRAELQSPWGPVVGEDQLDSLIPALDSEASIAVGDATTANLLRRGFVPRVQVCDSRIMRERVQPVAGEYESRIGVRNPAGHITDEAYGAIITAIRSKHRCLVDVDGEEDLLALVAMAEAPEGWFVLYGQPQRGMVVVRVDTATKNRAKNLLLAMPRVDISI